MLRPGLVCLMYDTGREILCSYIRLSAPQDRGEQRPLRAGPIGPGRRREDAHIVGYYAPAAGTAAEEGLGHRDGAFGPSGARGYCVSSSSSASSQANRTRPSTMTYMWSEAFRCSPKSDADISKICCSGVLSSASPTASSPYSSTRRR